MYVPSFRSHSLYSSIVLCTVTGGKRRCDDDGNSLVTCRSACENMMVACQNQKDMWRCGESRYFNGYEAEEPDTDGNEDPVYLRDFFPGTTREAEF